MVKRLEQLCVKACCSNTSLWKRNACCLTWARRQQENFLSLAGPVHRRDWVMAECMSNAATFGELHARTVLGHTRRTTETSHAGSNLLHYLPLINITPRTTAGSLPSPVVAMGGNHLLLILKVCPVERTTARIIGLMLGGPCFRRAPMDLGQHPGAPHGVSASRQGP